MECCRVSPVQSMLAFALVPMACLVCGCGLAGCPICGCLLSGGFDQWRDQQQQCSTWLPHVVMTGSDGVAYQMLHNLYGENYFV
jgi:hypothetical protein